MFLLSSLVCFSKFVMVTMGDLAIGLFSIAGPVRSKIVLSSSYELL